MLLLAIRRLLISHFYAAKLRCTRTFIALGFFDGMPSKIVFSSTYSSPDLLVSNSRDGFLHNFSFFIGRTGIGNVLSQLNKVILSLVSLNR